MIMHCCKYRLLLSLTLISFQLQGQELNVDKIYGTWEGSETEIDESLLLSDKSSYESKSNKTVKTFYFQENGFVDVVELGEQFKLPYSMQDSILIIGNHLKYKILNLQKTQITLETIGFFENELILEKRGNLQPIPTNETIQTYHPNGRKKLQGLKEYGFKKGVWTQWYEDGHVKQVDLYENHMPIMTVMFDSNGYIISKRWFDFSTQTFKEE